VREDIAKLIAKSKKHGDAASLKAKAALIKFLDRLAAYRVLDPACGSGNFLYLALKTLKDIEHSVHIDAEALGVERPLDLVTSPANVLGIELNEYAAELARVTVWIGELQWRLQHGYPFKQNPVLEPLDHIECRDALLTTQAKPTVVRPEPTTVRPEPTAVRPEPTAVRPEPVEGPAAVATSASTSSARTVMMEASWPRADAVIGNPPFVGGSKKRRELGDETFEALAKIYERRVPPGADLVCYWFDKALQQMKRGELARAGFVSTNSIRGGSNRDVLDAIVKDGAITDAWSDEIWVNDGAAVRVSLVCFTATADEAEQFLDGETVTKVNSDLTSSQDGIDLTIAKKLPENANACFQGSQKIGSFDIEGSVARRWLTRPNAHGRSNAEVLKPSWNGLDLTRRNRDGWIVDFGVEMSEREASLYEAPFQHVLEQVKPERAGSKDGNIGEIWWRHGRPRPALREQLRSLNRYIAVAATSKHVAFSFVSAAILPDKQLIVTTRANDATFGILHSRFHELWSLRLGTSLEDRPRYTPTTCFETFPFPAGLTPRDTAHQRTEVLADGAVIPAGVENTVRPETASEGSDGRAALNAGQTLRCAQGERTPELRKHAITIARAAKRLNDLRERWLNPPEWTERVAEVIPLGMETSPYPDRILPRANLGADDLAALKKRTLTNLYNQRPAWLADAHAALDAAVAGAYGWTEYSAATTDNEILARLLALNLERAGNR
jgi:hypothetical protein